MDTSQISFSAQAQRCVYLLDLPNDAHVQISSEGRTLHHGKPPKTGMMRHGSLMVFFVTQANPLTAEERAQMEGALPYAILDRQDCACGETDYHFLMGSSVKIKVETADSLPFALAA